MLEVSDLCAGYVRDIDILRGLTLEVPTGSVTTVIGANGVGKSTLLKCIVGQLRPHAGRIVFDGMDITGARGLTPSQAASLVSLGAVSD